jgi:threonine dehydrogenase-like Zn-dependent dehydrogenase
MLLLGGGALTRCRSAPRRALAFRMGQTHVHRYLRPLLERIRGGEIDPSYVVSHRLPLSRAPEAYGMWNDKTDDCTKIVLDPAA